MMFYYTKKLWVDFFNGAFALFVLGLGIPGFFFFFEDSFAEIPLLVFLFGPLFLVHGFVRTRLAIRGLFFDNRALEIDDEGFLFHFPLWKTKVPWSSVERIVVAKENFYSTKSKDFLLTLKDEHLYFRKYLGWILFAGAPTIKIRPLNVPPEELESIFRKHMEPR